MVGNNGYNIVSNNPIEESMIILWDVYPCNNNVLVYPFSSLIHSQQHPSIQGAPSPPLYHALLLLTLPRLYSHLIITIIKSYFYLELNIPQYNPLFRTISIEN